MNYYNSIAWASDNAARKKTLAQTLSSKSMLLVAILAFIGLGWNASLMAEVKLEVTGTTVRVYATTSGETLTSTALAGATNWPTSPAAGTIDLIIDPPAPAAGGGAFQFSSFTLVNTSGNMDCLKSVTSTIVSNNSISSILKDDSNLVEINFPAIPMHAAEMLEIATWEKLKITKLTIGNGGAFDFYVTNANTSDVWLAKLTKLIAPRLNPGVGAIPAFLSKATNLEELNLGNHAIFPAITAAHPSLKTITLSGASIALPAKAVADFYTGLTTINLPEATALTTSNTAAASIASVTTVNAPKLITIPQYAFDGWTNLATLTTGTLTTVAKAALRGTKITTITLPSVPDSVLAGCTELTTATTTATTIGPGAFAGCTKLTTVTNTGALTAIGANAFDGCKLLTTFALPVTACTFGARAFYDCNALTAITLGTGTSSVADSAFYGCNAASLTITNDFAGTIGKHAFYNLASTGATIAELDITTATDAIGTHAFAGANIKAVKTKLLADSMFLGCTSLETIDLTGIAASFAIEEGAFAGCTKLAAVTLPTNVSAINAKAFEGCTGMATLTIENTSNTPITLADVNALPVVSTKPLAIVVPNAAINAYNKASTGAWKTIAEDKTNYRIVPVTNKAKVTLTQIVSPAGAGTITGTYTPVGGSATAIVSGTTEVPYGATVKLSFAANKCFAIDASSSTGWSKGTSPTPIAKPTGTETYPIIDTVTTGTGSSIQSTYTIEFIFEETADIAYTATATETSFKITAKSLGSTTGPIDLSAVEGDTVIVAIDEDGMSWTPIAITDTTAGVTPTAMCSGRVRYTAVPPTDGCYEIEKWTTKKGTAGTAADYKQNGTDNFTGTEVILPFDDDYEVIAYWKKKTNIVTGVVEGTGETSTTTAKIELTPTDPSGSVVEIQTTPTNVACQTEFKVKVTAPTSVNNVIFDKWVIEPAAVATAFGFTELQLREIELSFTGDTVITSSITIKAVFKAGEATDVQQVSALTAEAAGGDLEAGESATGAKGDVLYLGGRFNDLATLGTANSILTGTSVTLTAVPNDYSVFVKWYWEHGDHTTFGDAGNDSASTADADTYGFTSDDDLKANPLTFTVGDDSARFTAVFKLRPLNVTINVSPAAAAAEVTVAPASTALVYGATANITLGTANAGYTFVGLFNDAGQDVTNTLANGATPPDYVITSLKGDTTLTARYSIVKHTITYAEQAGGVIRAIKLNNTATNSAISGLKVNYGTKVTIQVIPNTGYKLSSIKAGATGSETDLTLIAGETDKYEIGPIEGDIVVLATFAVSNNSRVIWKSNNSNGTITMTGATASGSSQVLTAVTNGTNLTFTATPSNGAEFVEWQISTNSGTTTQTGATLVHKVAKDVVITAIFKSAISTGSSAIVEMEGATSVESDGTPVYTKIVQKPEVAVDATKLGGVSTTRPGKISVEIWTYDAVKDPVNFKGELIYSEELEITDPSKPFNSNLGVALFGNGRGLMITTVRDANGAIVTTETTVFKFDNVRRPFIKVKRTASVTP